MSVIHRFRITLEGFPGAPGVNTIFALAVEERQTDPAELNNFGETIRETFTAVNDLLVPGMYMNWDGDVDVLEVGDAALVDRIGGLDPWRVYAAGGTSNTSRASQIKLRYKTDRIRGRRFLSGGIFFGPISHAAIGDDGGITNSASQRIADAHGGLLDIAGGVRLAVWGQPTPVENPVPGGPVNNGDGVAGYVQTVGVMPRPAVLRRRRD